MNTAPRALRLGYAGTPKFALPALRALLQSAHRVVAVFTQPDRPAGRGQVLHSSPVKQLALEHGLEVLEPPSFKTAAAFDAVRRLELDALVVVAYGLLLPAAVLALPRLGCFNIHASLLPRWRGAAPIQRALLAGDRVTGVTIMRMEAALDTGPMLAVRELPIAALDTADTLHDRLADLGASLIGATLESVADGSARERAQPEAGVCYADKITKAEALIDWREPADAIERRVRAFNPWPVAATTWQGEALRVWEASLTPAAQGGPGHAPGTVVSASDAGIDVACGRGALRIVRLQRAGRKALAAAEFLKAQPLAGVRFASAT